MSICHCDPVPGGYRVQRSHALAAAGVEAVFASEAEKTRQKTDQAAIEDPSTLVPLEKKV